MWSRNSLSLCRLWLVCVIVCPFVSVLTDDQSDQSIVLDDNLRRLALGLFRTFSDKSQLSELITNGDGELGQLEKFPVRPVAEIYRNYTLEQIDCLQRELSEHRHFIYQPIEEKAKDVSTEFEVACRAYDRTGDLQEFEQRFIQTGNEVVAMQKMVLRIINSKLEDRLKHSSDSGRTNHRSGRNWITDLFDRLNHLFLGGPESDLYKSSDYSQVNKMYALMQALERIENAQPTDLSTQQNVNKLRALLFRLRKVYQLNRIASVPNVYLNTDNISPYSYEAMLRLVQLLGTVQSIGQQFNPIMTLFRSWMNFFNGGNIFAALMNPFGGSGGVTSVTRRPKYDANRIRRLIQLIEENDRVQQQQIERNRQKLALENLIKNQNKQQQQIDEILKALVSVKGGHQNQRPTVEPNPTTYRPPWLPPSKGTGNNNNGGGFGGSASTRWPSMPPMRPVPSSPADVLKQLKDQRRHLNDLLQELQKPPTGVSPPSSGIKYPPIASGQQPPPSMGQMPSNQDIMQAQQALMGIMKNITPMINMMGQTGLVSRPRLEQSTFQLLDILKAVNGRELDDETDTTKEMQRVERLGEKLESVLDGIIDEAENKTSKAVV